MLPAALKSMASVSARGRIFRQFSKGAFVESVQKPTRKFVIWSKSSELTHSNHREISVVSLGTFLVSYEGSTLKYFEKDDFL